MACAWKPNWHETRQHFMDWWNGTGMVFSYWGPLPEGTPHEQVQNPAPPPTLREAYTDPIARAKRNHYHFSRHSYPFDNLPIADTMIGPGSLALMVGCEPGFSPQTVWFEPAIADVPAPETLPPIRFDAGNEWFKMQAETCRECVKLGQGKYLTGCPDLAENVDILSAMRDPQTLMFDMIERPEWVEQKVSEINQVFFDAYQRIYDIIKLEDGSSAFTAFSLWGPGKTVKVQCDAAAMFSPAMFRRFVVPALTEQCEWLDHSMFHLDGTQCICQLDPLLEIEALDAVEWTPQAGIEGGGNRRWFDLYKRVRAAGKSVQAIGVLPSELKPLLDELGPDGMYIAVSGNEATDVDEIAAIVESFR